LRTLEGRCLELGTTAEDLDVGTLDALMDTFPLSRSSRQLAKSVLTHFWIWRGRDARLARAIRLPSKPKMKCRALDESHALALELEAHRWGHPEGTAVLVGLYAALRRAEIAALRWDALAGDWLTLVGKGGVTAAIPVHRVLREVLERIPVDDEWIFPGAGQRGHVSPTTVWTWIRKVSDSAGIPTVSTHELRHTSLTTALDRTHDLRAVQELARHARPETTAGYTRTTARRLVAVVNHIDYQAAADEALEGLGEAV
jgi:integrase